MGNILALCLGAVSTAVFLYTKGSGPVITTPVSPNIFPVIEPEIVPIVPSNIGLLEKETFMVLVTFPTLVSSAALMESARNTAVQQAAVNSGVKIGVVNAMENPEIALMLDVRNYPSVMFVLRGSVLADSADTSIMGLLNLIHMYHDGLLGKGRPIRTVGEATVMQLRIYNTSLYYFVRLQNFLLEQAARVPPGVLMVIVCVTTSIFFYALGNIGRWTGGQAT